MKSATAFKLWFVSTECVTEKDCMNGGIFINATCECECPDWFEGDFCEGECISMVTLKGTGVDFTKS